MAGVVRISGLVGLAARVRALLAAGGPGPALAGARSGVVGALAQVDEILRVRGAGVADLAAPSGRAYRYLAGLRWDGDGRPARAAGGRGDAADMGKGGTARGARPANTAAGPQVRWSGLGRFAERLIARLAADPTGREAEEVRRAIEAMSGRMEGATRRAGVGADGLTAGTREWRGWLAWMSAADNLGAYLRAAEVSRGVLGVAKGAGAGGAKVVVDFRPMRFIYRMRARGGVTHVMMPTPMVSFDEAGFADLAALVFGTGRTAKQRVVERMKAEAYADLRDQLEGLGGVVDGTKGAVHDLGESFGRVNARYFGGQMARPRLTWSRSMTRRKFGHYDHVRDAVMLSSTMDQAGVPGLVVDYVMYHELLHKRHGIRWSNGRGYAHTADFYRDERKFDGWQQGEEWIKKLARGEVN